MRVLLGGLMVSLAFGSALPAQTPSPPTEAAVPNVDQRRLAMDLATRLESDFVYAEQGKRYASALRRNASRGDYDGLKGGELALKLSDDLQSVAPDGHLRPDFPISR